MSCGSCSKVYIDQMGRTMEHCLKEHKRTLTSGITAQSAVAEHAVQMHEINWKEAEVDTSHLYYYQVCMLEAWHIRMEHQRIYRDAGPLAEYNPLIHQLTPAAVRPHYYHSMLPAYCTCTCSDILIYAITIIITTIIPFLTSPPVTNSCQSCIKTPAGFVTSFLTDEDPGLGRNV